MKPYLFSQGQAINNRSWIPTQDSPGIRQSWTASITVPAGLTAVMSGERLTPAGEPAGDGRRRFRFRMDRNVPPYLIALAVGTVVCALAPSVEVLIVGRVIQGAAGGIFPLAFAIIRDEFPREKVAGSIGLMSSLLGIGGGAGTRSAVW